MWGWLFVTSSVIIWKFFACWVPCRLTDQKLIRLIDVPVRRGDCPFTWRWLCLSAALCSPRERGFKKVCQSSVCAGSPISLLMEFWKENYQFRQTDWEFWPLCICGRLSGIFFLKGSKMFIQNKHMQFSSTCGSKNLNILWPTTKLTKRAAKIWFVYHRSWPDMLVHVPINWSLCVL